MIWRKLKRTSPASLAYLGFFIVTAIIPLAYAITYFTLHQTCQGQCGPTPPGMITAPLYFIVIISPACFALMSIIGLIATILSFRSKQWDLILISLLFLGSIVLFVRYGGQWLLFGSYLTVTAILNIIFYWRWHRQKARQ